MKPLHEFFIGIDSDGCVFDTMEIKQKEYFIPNAIKYFNLNNISKILRETWEFVNLYSRYRGGNRFPAMIKVFELLEERDEIIRMGFKLPDMSSLKKWVINETKLGNAGLQTYYDKARENSLEPIIEWTEAINRQISEGFHSIPPFCHALKSIKKISAIADIIVVSQTPLEALEKEWIDNNLIKYVRLIAGQEHGTKEEHIALAAGEKYPPDKILLIGDAFGDMNAAKNNGVLFYPVLAGKEDESWKRFLDEGLDRFINGTYRGSYEESLLKVFSESLPEVPPWKTVK